MGIDFERLSINREIYALCFGGIEVEFSKSYCHSSIHDRKNREEWNRHRDINMRYLRTGKALITLSTISAAIAIPVIYKRSEMIMIRGFPIFIMAKIIRTS